MLHVPYQQSMPLVNSTLMSFFAYDGYIKDQLQLYEDDCIYPSLILGVMSNTFFNLFCNYFTTVKLWTALHARYATKDEGNYYYLINKFVDYIMVDGKPILELSS